jgi:N-methylhydantoinase B
MQQATAVQTPDLVTTSVIQAGLFAAVKEMATTLERAAFSPILWEYKDFGAIITDANGKLWAEAPGLVVFVGTAHPDIVAHGVEKFGRDGFAPGDVVLASDPFTTGTHVSDVTIYTPVFASGELVAFCAVSGHWADVGGKEPSGWCPDSIDVYQDGLRFPHVKLHEAGRPNETLLEVLAANVRFPVPVRGDLEAQIASCRTGADRIGAVVDRYGTGVVRAAMSRACDDSERAYRKRIAELPDGVYVAESFLDHDGVEQDVRRPIKLTLTVSGEDIVADFTGSSQTARGPINLPFTGTRGAVNAALKAVLAPSAPANDGVFRVIEVIAPENTIVNPSPPAPTDCFGYTVEAILDLTLEALAEVVPDRCPASLARICTTYFSRVNPLDGTPFIYAEGQTVGWGGRPSADGANMAFTTLGDTPSIPSEVVELRFPMRTVRNELSVEGAGAGTYRGGPGLLREYEMLDDGVYLHAAFIGDLVPPRGVGGGVNGTTPQVVIWPGTPKEQVHRGRFPSTGPLNRGDRVRIVTGGGGGWGPPAGRDPARVLEDVRNGFVTEADAVEVYRVAVRATAGDVELDDEATAQLRAAHA